MAAPPPISAAWLLAALSTCAPAVPASSNATPVPPASVWAPVPPMMRLVAPLPLPVTADDPFSTSVCTLVGSVVLNDDWMVSAPEAIES